MPSLLDELTKSRDIQQRDGILVCIVKAAAEGAWMPPEIFDDVFELLDATGYRRRAMLTHYGNPWGGSLEDVVLALSQQMRYAASRQDMLERFHHGDPRQQFICAFVLARTGCLEEMDALLAYWKPHLEDNAIAIDGSWARRAIVGLGINALPTLRLWRGDPDDSQMADYLDAAIEGIEATDKDPWERAYWQGVPELPPSPWRVVAAIHGQPSWSPPAPSALVARGWTPNASDFDEEALTTSPEAPEGDGAGTDDAGDSEAPATQTPG